MHADKPATTNQIGFEVVLLVRSAANADGSSASVCGVQLMERYSKHSSEFDRNTIAVYCASDAVLLKTDGSSENAIRVVLLPFEMLIFPPYSDRSTP